MQTSIKSAIPLVLALSLLAGPALAVDGWPAELDGAEHLVRSTLGDVSPDRLDVRRHGRVVEVSIRLDEVPAQFRSRARSGALEVEDEVFLATSFIQPFRDEGAIAEFSLMPNNAHLIDHFFGFWVFNFGKKVKMPMEIAIFGENGEQEKVKDRKKKFKIKRKSLTLRFVRGQVSAPGFYALHTSVGPHSLTTYFCNDCVP